MPHDTELARLILQMRESIGDDIRDAKQDLAKRCDDIVARQIEQNGRVNKHEALLASHHTATQLYAHRLDAIERGDLEAAKAIASLGARLEERSKGTIRGFIASLTPKQKAAFWSAVLAGSSFLVERGWQITRALSTLLRGVPQ